MSYPQIIDYNEAVQSPQQSFADPALQRGRFRTTPLGLPLALSGGAALTYTVDAGARKFAVRCFHREIPEIERRYAAISASLARLTSPYFVAFEFQPAGIRVRGKAYPIVKMDWVEGDTLGVFLDRNARDGAAVAALRRKLFELAQHLEQNGIAHGDVQNENVMVEAGNLRLIDYDGMYVEGLRRGAGTEIGHRHFQHPARGVGDFGPDMDRFSFIAIDVSLAAIEMEPRLHEEYREGGTAILFKANDFADPDGSRVFRVLRGYPALSAAVDRLAALCKSGLSDTPSLADFRDGKVAAGSVSAVARARATDIGYIGAFDVVDASRYADVHARVGSMVELVGRIVYVHEGVGRRGKGLGKPYVIISFGDPRVDKVQLNIWSYGLQKLGNRPDPSWEGSWVSATGLIDPPFERTHYGAPVTSVGITIRDQSQIVPISEDEAMFRLGRTRRRVGGGADASMGTSPSGPASPTAASNHAVLRRLGIGAAPGGGRGGHTPPPPPFPGAAAPSTSGKANDVASSNSAVLATIAGNTAPTKRTRPVFSGTAAAAPAPAGPAPPVPPPPVPTPPVPTSSGSSPTAHRTPLDGPPMLARIPRWLWPSWWWVGVAIVISLLLG